MAPLTIIEDFNVLKNISRGLRSGLVVPPMNPLPFQRGEETFGHRVIVAISCPAHAACDPLTPQQVLKILAGVLTTTIAVMNEARRRRALA